MVQFFANDTSSVLDCIYNFPLDDKVPDYQFIKESKVLNLFFETRPQFVGLRLKLGVTDC